jgi:putative ABC transport system ATP-binding protein
MSVAAPNAPAARAVALSKVYGSGDTAVSALRAVDVNFDAGRFTAIMGPSGSGKSTLMHCMAGLDAASSGQVFIGDSDLTVMKDNELTRLRRERMGFVFQAFNLVPTLTAEENITLPIDIAGGTVDREWFDIVVGTVGLADRLTHRPTELSGGQQQRVACARALVTRPEIVFADEPTGNLDSRSGAEVLSFLRRSVNQYGQTIVMVTHDAHAAAYADRVIFLADGRLVDELRDPDATAILDRMKSFEQSPGAYGSVRRPDAQGNLAFPAGAQGSDAALRPGGGVGRRLRGGHVHLHGHAQGHVRPTLRGRDRRRGCESGAGCRRRRRHGQRHLNGQAVGCR